MSTDTSISVAVVLLVRGNKVFALRRGPTAPWMPGCWNLPGGVLEAGESKVAAARRECLEEAGVEPRDLTHVGSGYADCAVDAFAGRSWEGEPSITDDESDACAWVGLDDLDGYEWVPLVKDLIRKALTP